MPLLEEKPSFSIVVSTLASFKLKVALSDDRYFDAGTCSSVKILRLFLSANSQRDLFYKRRAEKKYLEKYSTYTFS